VEPPTQLVPILNYHTISDRPGRQIAPFAVRTDQFARQLDAIVAGGFIALPVSTYVERLHEGAGLPGRTVVITFDDGFEDNLTVAAPLLLERGLPATVFVTTGHLPGCPGGSAGQALGPMIPWDRLGELEAAGIEVGAHAHSHRPLDVLDRAEAGREIELSKHLLEGALGHPVAAFSYPHGYASAATQDLVRGGGFRSACGVRHALSHTGDNPWLLSRLVVGPTTTVAELDGWLHGSGARVARRHELLRTKVWRGARRAWASGEPVQADRAPAGSGR
jgi:peptidoglycan/xylan/chitin deacetylase (PgdA/CDA1 family)